MAKGKEILTDGRLAILLVIVILIIDQVIKIEVKTSMSLGEAIHVTDWFYIDFVENNGMAYGMTFINKLVLSILRLVAITVIARYIWKVVKQGMRTRYIVFLSMILAGAMGNMIDSMFYGLIFNASTPFTVASFVTKYAAPGGARILMETDGLSLEAMVSNAVAPEREGGRTTRSEERRVGKECRSRWSPYH